MSAGEPLVPHTFTLPSTPPPGYVDLAVTHCGICHSDLHQIDNAWGVACFPLVAGHEIVGTITAIGDAPATNKFKVGDRAAIGVQRSCCRSCAECSAGLENVCRRITKTYAGARTPDRQSAALVGSTLRPAAGPGKDKGGFARFIRYPAAWVFAAPGELPSEVVGPLMCAGITTYSPLKRFARRGDKVGVVGIGGLGHMALQARRRPTITAIRWTHGARPRSLRARWAALWSRSRGRPQRRRRLRGSARRPF
jgi:D-arabinose 1-dehydrogenase-like Zn-dependent alcohol dehydrogenase